MCEQIVYEVFSFLLSEFLSEVSFLSNVSNLFGGVFGGRICFRSPSGPHSLWGHGLTPFFVHSSRFSNQTLILDLRTTAGTRCFIMLWSTPRVVHVLAHAGTALAALVPQTNLASRVSWSYCLQLRRILRQWRFRAHTLTSRNCSLGSLQERVQALKRGV